jgi:hypothetical protein
MSQSKRTSITPGLRVFIEKVITPVVLIVGIIFLIYFNFKGVLKATKISQDQYNGVVAFNQGNLSYQFLENAGSYRPNIKYGSSELLAYAEWSSTYAVNGLTGEIWNNAHGYDYDATKQQVFSTISGTNWQLIEVITLTNDHTVTVTFEFATRTNDLTPATYEFDIAHVVDSSNEWANIQATDTSFTAQVVAGKATAIAAPTSSTPVGTISLAASGEFLAPQGVKVNNEKDFTNGAGTISVAQGFYTKYTITNPTPLKLYTLGTETLTFSTATTSLSTPSNYVVDMP